MIKRVLYVKCVIFPVELIAVNTYFIIFFYTFRDRMFLENMYCSHIYENSSEEAAIRNFIGFSLLIKPKIRDQTLILQINFDTYGTPLFYTKSLV